MARKFFKRFSPDQVTLREHPIIARFGGLLLDPNLWHLSRRSVPGACAIGLFWAFIPIPAQMLCAAACAIFLRVNLPLSVALVWLTNPFTIPPIFYLAYLLGTWLLSTPPVPQFHLSLRWIGESWNLIWEPLMLGSLVFAFIGATVGYFGTQLFWRVHLIRYMKMRALRRKHARLLAQRDKQSHDHPPGHGQG